MARDSAVSAITTKDCDRVMRLSTLAPALSLSTACAPLHLAHYEDVLAILRSVRRLLRTDNIIQGRCGQFRAVKLKSQRVSD